MVEALHIEVLGGLRITQGGDVVRGFVSAKASALVAYLAVTGRPHGREALAGLLWGERSQADASAGLRVVLSNLRKVLAPFLIISRETVAFNRDASYSLDLERFEALLQAHTTTIDVGGLHEATALYQGDFLEGFYVRDAPDFEEWAAGQRERLRHRAMYALHQLAVHHTAQGDYAGGIDALTRLLHLDPWREEAHRQLMLLLAQSGQRDAALAQYERCRRVLLDELGAEPADATLALVEQIRANQVPVQVAPPSPSRSLPIPPTPLLGRDHELAQLATLLKDPRCRLLTLVGPGGIGKTRLALGVARSLVADFADGVCFVALAGVTDPTLVVPTIMQALGVPDDPGVGNRAPLVTYLRNTQLLLLLDNFEQVRGAACDIGDLLAAAPQLKVLVTSRSVLHLYGEREWRVPPLDLPDLRHLPPMPDHLARYAAIQLFMERAQAVKPDFALTSATAHAIAEICVRLDGLPLAIELAAARVKLLPPQVLVGKLVSRLTLLRGGPQNVPARQQTLRDTLAWSYDLLRANEQQLFRRLGVFVGSFSLNAAMVVGHDAEDEDHGLDTLQSLIDQSLVQPQAGSDGEPRFGMLETIRAYALEHLTASHEAEVVRQRHAAFFLALGEASASELRGRQQVAWLNQLEAEHDNLRAALAWSLRQADPDLGLRLASALGAFWHIRGYLSEGRSWLETVLARVTHGGAPPDRAQHGVTPLRQASAAVAYAKALNAASKLARTQGDFTQAMVWLAESLAQLRTRDDPQTRSDTLNNLGICAGMQGQYAAAQRYFEESLAVFRTLHDRRGIAMVLNNLGMVVQYRGNYEGAFQLLEESLALKRDLGDTRDLAITLNSLGYVAMRLSNYAGARRYLEESLRLRHLVGDKVGIAGCLLYLGKIEVLSQGDYAQATRLLQESLDLCCELHDKVGIAAALHSQGELAFVEGNYRAAAARYTESLALECDMGNKDLIAECLERLAEVWVTDGQPARAAQLLGAAETVRDTRQALRVPMERAAYERTVAAIRRALGEAAFAVGWEEGRAMTLEQVMQSAHQVV